MVIKFEETRMKKTMLALGIIYIVGMNVFGTVYIKYYNKDSQEWTFSVKMDGQTKSVTFNRLTSGAATIGGSGTKAVVTTRCGDVTIMDNSKIEIKDGCIKFVN